MNRTPWSVSNASMVNRATAEMRTLRYTLVCPVQRDIYSTVMMYTLHCVCVCVCCVSAPLDSMLRSLVLGAHGHYGNTATIAEAQNRYFVYM